MSDSDTTVGDDDGPAWARDEQTETDHSPTTDDSHVTADYPADAIGKGAAENPEPESRPESDPLDNPTSNERTNRRLRMAWNLLPTLSDKEPESGYQGWLSTQAEIGVFAFGLFLGSLLAHGAVSVEILAALGGLGFLGAGAAARKEQTASRDSIQSNIEHYVLGIAVGFSVVYLPHEVLPPGFEMDDLAHLFGQHSHASSILFDALAAVL